MDWLLALVIYAAAVRTARMDEVLAAIDQDVGAGSIRIGTTGMGATLVTIPFADPAGSVSGDVLTFDCTPAISAAASATGTAAAAIITDNSGDTIVSGLTVGLSSANVILDSLSITSGQTVTITAGSLTHNTAG